MAENQKSIDGIIEKLALIADATDSLFPEGRKAVVFELKRPYFKKVQNNFRDIDKLHKQFKIDISGVEFIFLLDESLNDETNNS
jgi:hypothetical protein